MTTEIDSIVNKVDRAFFVPKTEVKSAGPKRPRSKSANTPEGATAKLAKRRPRRAKPPIGEPRVDLNPTNVNTDPVKPEETGELLPIPIPFVDPEILKSLKNFKEGGVPTFVGDRFSRYLTGKGVPEDEVNKMNASEALRSISEKVEADFTDYILALYSRTDVELEKAGLEFVTDFKSPLGDEDKKTPLAVTEEIWSLLSTGTVETEKEETEARFRKLEQDFVDANVRANGIKHLDEYFRLNGMHSLSELNEVHLGGQSGLMDYFSDKLKDLSTEDEARFVFDSLNQPVKERSGEDYLVKIAEFKRAVSILSGTGEIDDFDHLEDIADFIEKTKLVARDEFDLLNKIAKKIDIAAIAAISKKNREQAEAAKDTKGAVAVEDIPTTDKDDPSSNGTGINGKTTAIDEDTPVIANFDPEPRARKVGIPAKHGIEAEKSKRSLKDRLLFRNRGKDKKPPVKPVDEPKKEVEEDGGNGDIPPIDTSNDRNERRNNRPRGRNRGRFGIGNVLVAALAGGAIATGAIAVFEAVEHFDDDSGKNPTTTTINIGDNFNGNYGLVDKSNNGSGNTNSINSGTVDKGNTDNGNGNGSGNGNGPVGEIKLSGDMNQDLAKLYLDNKSDSKIGDGIHIKAADAGKFFKSLGVDKNPERYTTLFEGFTDQDPTTSVVDLSTKDADIVAFDFRTEDLKLSVGDQTGLATFGRDRTVDLKLPETNVSTNPTPSVSPTESPTVTATGTSTPDNKTAVTSGTGTAEPDKTPTIQPSPTFSPVITATNTATFTATFTPTPTNTTEAPTSTYTPTSTATAPTGEISAINKSIGETQKIYALGYGNDSSNKWLPLAGAPMFAGFVQSVSLLKKEEDDDEEDKDGKKKKKKHESK